MGTVPDIVVSQAKAAFAFRAGRGVARVVTIDHGPGDERRIFFEQADVRVELWVGAKGTRRVLRGRVHPRHERVELELVGANTRVSEAGNPGLFAFDAVPRTVARLRLIVGSGGEQMLTDWFRV